MKNQHLAEKRRVHLSYLIALLCTMAWAQHAPAQAREVGGCTMSQLNVNATIPKGYTRLNRKCPTVAYIKHLGPNHVWGVFIIERRAPYPTSNKLTPTEFVNQQVLVTHVVFDQKYFGQDYDFRRIEDKSDYPPSLLEHGGACGEFITRFPVPGRTQKGVEWRRGIICLAKLPLAGSDKWKFIQAFLSDTNLERRDYVPGENFKQEAHRIFRSIHMKSPEELKGSE